MISTSEYTSMTIFEKQKLYLNTFLRNVFTRTLVIVAMDQNIVTYYVSRTNFNTRGSESYSRDIFVSYLYEIPTIISIMFLAF